MQSAQSLHTRHRPGSSRRIVAIGTLFVLLVMAMTLGLLHASSGKEFNLPIVATLTINLQGPEEVADVNEDGLVDLVDLRIVERNLGAGPPLDSRADVDRNDWVDIYDLSFVARYLELAAQ